MAKQDAAYFRSYRATKRLMQTSQEQELVRRAITQCAQFLRLNFAGRAMTGTQFAAVLEKSMLADETHATSARRQFIESLRGGQGEAK